MYRNVKINFPILFDKNLTNFERVHLKIKVWDKSYTSLQIHYPQTTHSHTFRTPYTQCPTIVVFK